ncbi:hypothetical protein H920_08589 [Fukomys damarensis]|uniref:Uncharacterized protein n=1 Tax=Fukomys damarensis TaxID=885580 RepID=A0A091E4F6_FUKDA|nr:hypothetical protein H920_08589 [Fukomys damarensis]
MERNWVSAKQPDMFTKLPNSLRCGHQSAITNNGAKGQTEEVKTKMRGSKPGRGDPEVREPMESRGSGCPKRQSPCCLVSAIELSQTGLWSAGERDSVLPRKDAYQGSSAGAKEPLRGSLGPGLTSGPRVWLRTIPEVPGPSVTDHDPRVNNIV